MDQKICIKCIVIKTLDKIMSLFPNEILIYTELNKIEKKRPLIIKKIQELKRRKQVSNYLKRKEKWGLIIECSECKENKFCIPMECTCYNCEDCYPKLDYCKRCPNF